MHAATGQGRAVDPSHDRRAIEPFHRTISVTATPSPLRGIALMLLSTLAFAMQNAVVRHVATELDPLEVLFFRTFFGVVVLLPTMLRHGFTPWRTQRLGLHAFRALINGVSTLLYFIALTLSPLATVAALFFSAPLFASVLAILVLREAVRLRRIIAIAIGFVGTLIIIRPDLGMIDLGAMCTLAAAATFGMIIVTIKVLSRTESSLTTTLYAAALQTPFAFIAALPVWQTPDLIQLAWLLATGALGSVGYLTMTQALKEADVMTAMPFNYSRLIWTAIVGYVAFGELPGVDTWIGGTIIFVAASYVAYREHQATRGTPPTAQSTSKPPAA